MHHLSVRSSSSPSHPMADTLQYTSSSQYMVPPPAVAYYSPQPPPHPHAIPPQRTEPIQRKRPKYTRSKTGCLTCRVKKIKCDETKPNCMRCTHGQRECTWPQDVPPRKKAPAAVKRETSEVRPSTAGSSNTSSPATRDASPPDHHGVPDEKGLRPLVSRRTSPYENAYHLHHPGSESRHEANGAYTHLRPLSAGAGPSRRPSSQPSSVYSSDSTYLPMPPMAQYPSSTSFAYNSPPVPHQPYRSMHPHSQPPSAMHSPMPHPQANTWKSTPLTTPVDPIEPYFHTVQERNLIRHYCEQSASIVMAVPFENPIVAANIPLVLSHLPGSDASAEALRLALLGVAAIHQSFLLAQSGATQRGADEMLQLAHYFRINSKQQLAMACSTVQGTQSDASLAASIAIALMDIFSGGRNWQRNMDLAKTLVNVRGGPGAMIAYGTRSQPGIVDGSSRARLLLDILACYELFACLGNGQEPTLLNSTSDSWWLDETHASESYVEQMFGMSRTFIPLLARVTAFVSRVINSRAHITELPTATTTSASIGGVTDANAVEESTLSTSDIIAQEARELFELLETWPSPVESLSPRVDAGNKIYQKAAQIMILRDVLHTGPEDALVQQCCNTVLSLCLQCVSSSMGVDLIWPVIVAGSNMYGNDRVRVAKIFAAFRTQCCYEIDTSEQIVLQVWKRLDQGHPQPDWRSVATDAGLSILIV